MSTKSSSCSCVACEGAACKCGCQNTKAADRRISWPMWGFVQVRSNVQLPSFVNCRYEPRVAPDPMDRLNVGPIRGITSNEKKLTYVSPGPDATGIPCSLASI
jgi:hypothetical protein